MSKTKKNDVSRESWKQIRRERILGPDSPYAIREAYVQLRTNLMLSLPAEDEQTCRVFAVTSANTSDGKSLTATNIAISFAMLGMKTLLIDCDMRKPVQHKLWGIKDQQGLSNFLTGMGKSVVQDVKGLPLSVMCAGTIPPNPSELAASKRFDATIRFLRGKYQYIILDTPPVNVVSDAQIISKNTDGVVLVARSGKTRREELLLASNTLERSGGRVCGVLVNGVNAKNAKNSYRYTQKYESKYSYENNE